jgi:uncharacterized protein involved in exopolysaccharide biosynthesis
MNTVEEKLYDPESGLRLGAVWRLAWASKSLIVIVTLVCAALAGVVAFNIAPIFRAQTVVLTVHNGTMGGAGSLSGQLGGLASIASLAGVNLDAAGGADREAKAILESRKMAEEFIKQRNLLDVILPKSEKTPTLWLAVKSFREGVLAIREDKRTGLTTLDFSWTDPSVAAEWANAFVALANERIRARAIDQASRNIKFLNEQIEKTKIVEVQHSLYSLIENETKTLMLANAKAEYAFTVIDPAVPPERKTSPHRSLYILFGAFLGSAIGLLVAYLRLKRRTADQIPRA